jgi:hypothetical protein
MDVPLVLLHGTLLEWQCSKPNFTDGLDTFPASGEEFLDMLCKDSFLAPTTWQLRRLMQI